MTEQIAIEAPDQQLSGIEIVEDIAQRVAAALAGNCYLRSSDGYQAYSAKVQIDMQLRDLDVTRISKSFAIGEPEVGAPSRPVRGEVSEARAREIRERSGVLHQLRSLRHRRSVGAGRLSSVVFLQKNPLCTPLVRSDGMKIHIRLYHARKFLARSRRSPLNSQEKSRTGSTLFAKKAPP